MLLFNFKRETIQSLCALIVYFGTPVFKSQIISSLSLPPDANKLLSSEHKTLTERVWPDNMYFSVAEVKFQTLIEIKIFKKNIEVCPNRTITFFKYILRDLTHGQMYFHTKKCSLFAFLLNHFIFLFECFIKQKQ